MLPNHRTEWRRFRGYQHLRRAQLALRRLPHAFPTMEFGLRHRLGESQARLCAREAFARLAKMAGVFSFGRHLPGSGLIQTMCTVTFIARRRGYCLGMNRDEKLARPTGLPPRKKMVNGRAVISPSEPGGGTWIALNDQGATLALINWYSIIARVDRN